ncbi:MAG: enoyl-CoA hydratase/isomerase family protein [Paracoccaceae bacterium]|nr:MAG: enoyl-CoA hydratase/isomerase family protein [Paracoccaceae bacterium]
MDDGGEGGKRPAVRSDRAGAVMVITIDAPPVNALGHAVRAGLWQEVGAAAGDAAVRAIVIRAEGRTFPAGADIAEFGKTPVPPLLPEVLDLIEGCAKPVVAAIHGQALGGGLELALAAHARVAADSARLGLPEVSLGILPGAGGTQRLPRLIGAEQALRLMLSGRPVPAAEALALGMLDRVVEGDPAAAAVEMAAALEAPRPTRERRDGMRDGRAYVAAVAAARAQAGAQALPAPPRIVDCVEAALLLPFEQGMAFERAAFVDLVDSPEARALRAAFFAERRAARMPGAEARARPVRAVLVIGAGEAGADVARALLAAGLRVTLADADRPALVAGLERIAATQEAAVAAGRLAPDAREADWARLAPALADGPPDPDAPPPDMVVLADGFAAPGVEMPPIGRTRADGAPVVTLGRYGRSGAQGVGLVLPPGRRLAELLVGAATAPETVATVLAVLKRIDRLPVQAGGRGIIGPLTGALSAAARHMAARAGAGAVARVLQGWNLGVAGIAGDAPPPAGLADRLIAAMANAGFRLLGEGAAQRPSDIDVAMVAGLGWPRHVAPPMLWAEERGLIVLRADLARWGQEAPDIWAPAPMVQQLVQNDIRMAALND